MDSFDIAPYLEGLYQSAVMQDWAQTRQIARDPDRYYEDKLSGLIGLHPSQGKVNAYMLSRMMGHYAINEVLPDSLKIPYELASLAEVARTIKNNKKIGLDYNKSALGLGAFLTAALAYNDNQNKKKKDVSINFDKIPDSDALGFILNKRW